MRREFTGGLVFVDIMSLVLLLSSACLHLSLEGGQLELPDVVNTPLLIRNAKIKMEEGHMRLAVDKWGKIS